MDYQGLESSIPQGAPPSTEELPQFEDLDPASRIKHEVLEDVLVVTPQLPELEDDATLEALRGTFRPLTNPFPAGSSSISSS